MNPRIKLTVTAALAVTGALGLAACGSEGVKVKGDTTEARGAQLFAERCAGCHTFDAAGTQGSATTVRSVERTDGPNFDVRRETLDQVLYAIRNGGFSGAIMPQNIVVGQDAEAVAEFVAKNAGKQSKNPRSPKG